MKSKILKAAFLVALITPLFAHAENYIFSFKANPGADGGGALSSNNDIDLTFFVDTSLAPSISISNLNRSEYWANGGFILEMSHSGNVVRLNEAIVSVAGPLRLADDGFFEIYSNIDEFFDIDFHPWSSFVNRSALPYEAFVYGQIDVYNNQQQFQDLYAIATTADNSSLKNYIVQVPEPTTVAMWILGAMVVSLSRKRPHV